MSQVSHVGRPDAALPESLVRSKGRLRPLLLTERHLSDYYTVLKAAIGGLQGNQAEARRSIYGDARNALIKELRAVAPPLSLAEISIALNCLGA